jgi:hypothetical protein
MSGQLNDGLPRRLHYNQWKVVRRQGYEEKERLSMETNANVQQKQLICRAPGCRFEVRDTEEDELITITQDHAQRKHQASLTAEYLRTALQPVEGSAKASH